MADYSQRKELENLAAALRPFFPRTGGTPSNSVVPETSPSQVPAAGVAMEYSRGDHTHGSPPPVPGPPGPPGPPSTGFNEFFTGETAPQNADTILSLTLTFPPLIPAQVLMFVNGLLQRNGDDFSVGGVGNQKITWTGTAPGTGAADFALAPTDVLTFQYST